MALQPSQVTSRSNSDLCVIDMISNDRDVPVTERMAAIVLIAEEYRKAVAGSTADPLRKPKPWRFKHQR